MINYDKSDQLIVAALEVVRDTDHAKWDAMRTARWSVTTDTGIFLTAAKVNPREALSLFAALLGSEALTDPQNRVTLIQPVATRQVAEHFDVPWPHVAASTLVHEYAHLGQSTQNPASVNEPPAYEAEAAFCDLLPGPAGPILARQARAVIADLAGAYAKVGMHYS